nr:hypothetical protein [Comamonas thiooxydans]
MAVADEHAAFEIWWGTPHIWSQGHKEAQWNAWQARAALTATPAAVPVDKSPELQGSMVDKTVNLQVATAAPVVLPEPVAFLHTLHDKQHKKVWFTRSNESGGVPVFTEQQLRALLATATGLPAQADTPDSFREWFAKNYPADTIIVDPDWHAKSIFRMAQAHARLAAPQAQADARDAVWLQPADMAALERFAETTDDDQSYDIGKDSVQRLSSFGCLKNCGFGRYEITSFGSYLLNDWERARILPFTTQADRDAAHRAAIAAAKGE